MMKGLKYDWIVSSGRLTPDDIVLEYQYLWTSLFIKDGKLYQVNSIDTIIESAPYQLSGHQWKEKERSSPLMY